MNLSVTASFIQDVLNYMYRLVSITDPNGVHVDVILQNIKLQEYLSHVPNETIRKTIKRLEDNSDIYETASNSTRLLTE